MKVLPPCVLKSGVTYSLERVEDEQKEEVAAIRVPLSQVECVSSERAARLVLERAAQPFQSLDDLLRRVELPLDAWDNLARSGALSAFGSRREVSWHLGRLAKLAPKKRSEQLAFDDIELPRDARSAVCRTIHRLGLSNLPSHDRPASTRTQAFLPRKAGRLATLRTVQPPNRNSGSRGGRRHLAPMSAHCQRLLLFDPRRRDGASANSFAAAPFREVRAGSARAGACGRGKTRSAARREARRKNGRLSLDFDRAHLVAGVAFDKRGACSRRGGLTGRIAARRTKTGRLKVAPKTGCRGFVHTLARMQLSFSLANTRHLTPQQLETHLKAAAGILRGKAAGQDYKTYILTLMFFKRLCDQWDYEADAKIRELEVSAGYDFSPEQKQRLRADAAVHRFSIPIGAHWRDVLATSENIGKKLTEAQRAISGANPDLKGVLNVDWNLAAPDGNGTLISNAVLQALLNHFERYDLSSASVPNDILGRAYEYLIKFFADDAGSLAGEFFTPPEVVDVLVRILEPQPGETVYDPTCGSGGLLIHCADFLEESGHSSNQLRYFGQEMNWQTYAIARINLILHGLEGDIRGGKSTLTDPLFLSPDGGSVRPFDLVMANFPFSDDFWFLPEDQRTDDDKKRAKKDKAKFKDSYGRFIYGNPPTSNGDFAFIQHILASAKSGEEWNGRAGVVCPQGVLFRGQAEVNEETGEFDANGEPKFRKRKADDEYLIRRGLLDAGLVEAVIALPLNLFYGAGVPACLLILRRHPPIERDGRVLFLYAARHFRSLSNKNQLRPQDVMRILVHYHAYGDADTSARFAASHSTRVRAQITQGENDELARIGTDYADWETRMVDAEREVAAVRDALSDARRRGASKADINRLEKLSAAKEKLAETPRKKVGERDEKLAETRRRASDERAAIDATVEELRALYADEAELSKHVRVVEREEIIENEYNLNIPRYVDTFEPEVPIDVAAAWRDLQGAETERQKAEECLQTLLAEVGYVVA